MEIAIDKAIEIIKHETPKRPTTIYGFMKKDSFTVAVGTMRKYQKIEQIYQKWNEVNDFSYNQAMLQIGEVLEDGIVD